MKTCAGPALRAAVYQAAERPPGAEIGAAVVEFTNVSGQPCVLLGHPSVAGAGNGSAQHNASLSVTRTGSASPGRTSAGSRLSAVSTSTKPRPPSNSTTAQPTANARSTLSPPEHAPSSAQPVSTDSSRTAPPDSPLFPLITVQNGEQLRLTATGTRYNLKPTP
ncbi:DUF4232 domain-containing protein [Streptomyces sp. NPDC048411]|uniref:DUF4232 domain-containing protein n=1 Tax=Streptomyces sp. NPDC048411 TaxID=3157206 RepID=UPI0034513402